MRHELVSDQTPHSRSHLQPHMHHLPRLNTFFRLVRVIGIQGVSSLPMVTTSPSRRRKRVALGRKGLLTTVTITLFVTICYACWATPGIWRAGQAFMRVLKRAWWALRTYDWKGAATFRVTPAMRTSVALSLILGVLLGAAVGVVSGLEPAVVVGVSASMAIGCVFVMSFAIIHGVNALRAISFALFVSLCLPFGFGFGFGVGILISIFLGLEDPEDVGDKTRDFVQNFPDFIKVVAAFTLEIL